MATRKSSRSKSAGARNSAETKRTGKQSDDAARASDGQNNVTAKSGDEPGKSVKQAANRNEAAVGGVMPEDTTPESTANGATKSSAPAAEQPQTLATEQPVPSAPVKKTSQYVVTVDNQTGLTTRIEKLDETTGARKELSREEYLQVLSYASGTSAAPLYGGFSDLVPASSPETDYLTQAYYKGVAAFLNALTSTK